MNTQLLKTKHKELIKSGHLLAANWLFKQLLKKHGNFTIWDYQGEIWESGLATWIMDNFSWHNGRIASIHGSF